MPLLTVRAHGTPPGFDTVRVISPSPELEESVFSDSAYDFGRDVATGPSVGDQILSRIAEFLFDRTAPEDLNNARLVILWTLIVAGTVTAIFIFRKSAFARLLHPAPASRKFDFRDLGEHIGELDIPSLIRNAVAAGDYRLAVRWQFLRTLNDLDRLKLIRFAPYKTNFDYRRELGDQPLNRLFREICRVYEYAWYGRFELGKEAYERSRLAFEQLSKEAHDKRK